MDQQDARDKERFAAVEVERQRLLAMTEAEAMAEGTPTWYSRMRALREIEAAEYLKRIRANIVPPSRHKHSAKIIRNYAWLTRSVTDEPCGLDC